MKDELKKDDSTPPLAFTSLLAALMGGKGLQEVLDEIQQSEPELEDEQRNAATALMNEMYDAFEDGLKGKNIRDTPEVVAAFVHVLWRRMGEWQLEQVENGKFNSFNHSAHFFKSFVMLLDRFIDNRFKRAASPTPGCTCPHCEELRAKGQDDTSEY